MCQVTDLLTALQNGRLIEAIRCHRLLTGASLVESKNCIEAVRNGILRHEGNLGLLPHFPTYVVVREDESTYHHLDSAKDAAVDMFTRDGVACYVAVRTHKVTVRPEITAL